jgi:hypothetical protein
VIQSIRNRVSQVGVRLTEPPELPEVAVKTVDGRVVLESAEEFARWVNSVQWRVAKTMPTIPHEYTVSAWGDREAFWAAARFIRTHGYRARWRHHKPKPYFDLDGRMYWLIPPVINRARIGDPASGSLTKLPIARTQPIIETRP